MRVDCGAESFLPVCASCGWRALPRSTREAAVLVAERHAVAVHQDRRALDARNARASRSRRRLVPA